MDSFTPKSHGERVAMFRHAILGVLLNRELDHGQRIELLRELGKQPHRPTGSDTTRCYTVPTLERWLYAFKKGGLAALVPQGRSDRGRGRDLDASLRDLICHARRDRPVMIPRRVDSRLAHLYQNQKAIGCA